MAEKKFNVVIQAEIKTTDGDEFADTTLRYHNMSYESLVELEQTWGKFQQALIDLGAEKVASARK